MENNDHKFDCMICGSPLVYITGSEKRKCAICGNVYETNCVCEQGHYICDKCHAKPALVVITAQALQTKSDNPIEIAMQMMDDQRVHMHGPEHHYLVPAALLAAYYNAGGSFGSSTLADVLGIAQLRAAQVPGGVCGSWGCCGAAVGAGIFTSIISGSTSMSDESWGLCNRITAKCLDIIGKNGGPRCCKRDSFLAISLMVNYVAEHFGIQMAKSSPLVCHYSQYNRACRKEKCPFFPR
ncbi:MAG: SAM-dependent methyltransferase [Firmicutes bacterium]|nr:SAM-dependent methyltransferase [Bacillota bacterium]